MNTLILSCLAVLPSICLYFWRKLDDLDTIFKGIALIGVFYGIVYFYLQINPLSAEELKRGSENPLLVALGVTFMYDRSRVFGRKLFPLMVVFVLLNLIFVGLLNLGTWASIPIWIFYMVAFGYTRKPSYSTQVF